MDEQDSASIRSASGVVKWFDSRKGFGFIIGPSGQDVLAHFTNIEGKGFRILKDGWTVVYDADRTPRGWKAIRIVLPADALKPNPPEATPPLPPPSQSTPLPASDKGEKPKVVVVIKKPSGSDTRPQDTAGDSSGKAKDTPSAGA